MAKLFDLKAVLTGADTNPDPVYDLYAARKSCTDAYVHVPLEQGARLVEFVRRIDSLLSEIALPFPGGPVSVDRNFAERKLSEFLGPGRECRVQYVEHEWLCQLYVGADCYRASSTTGMLDAIANALMAAQGREEVV